MQNVTHRLSELFRAKSISIPHAERLVGAGNGTLLKAIKQERSISSEWLEKVADNFPDCNMNWLISGRGEMLIGEGVPVMLTVGPGIGPPPPPLPNDANEWKEKYYMALEKYALCMEEKETQKKG